VSSRYIIDEVVDRNAPTSSPHRAAVGVAASFPRDLVWHLQILGVAAQRAITDMRKSIQAFVLRLPISYFDSTKTGILISRIMTDAEGIRNLVGTGLCSSSGARHRGHRARRALWLNGS